MHRGMCVGLFLIGVFAMATGCATKAGPLAVLPMTSPTAAQQNLEGIRHYDEGKWQAARTRFESAIQADPQVPEAHFNLALTLHQLGEHEEARAHFRRAGELAPENKEIVEASIYRNHLGLSSTFERHIRGGYKY